ncbi:MAG: TIGR03790 family protein, partial [Terrimicrobiaceae bacterium]|nr:TIGR03790 family protein [Terrimicrobiaceae bacterium]
MTACAWFFRALAAAGLALAVAGWAEAARAQDAPPEAVVVLYNSADPESVSLAKYYALRRGIAENRLIGLDAPLGEEISRLEFNARLAAPFRAEMLARGFWKDEPLSGRITASSARFLAIMRGIPLKISQDETLLPMTSQPAPIGTRNEASVDSELMALAIAEAGPAGAVPNPYYSRYLRVTDLSANPEILLASRGDGPDILTARAMIDDALQAELAGLWGWGYIDARGIKTGGMAEGDNWLRAAGAAMRHAGIPVLMDSSEQTLPEGFPVTQA